MKLVKTSSSKKTATNPNFLGFYNNKITTVQTREIKGGEDTVEVEESDIIINEDIVDL